MYKILCQTCLWLLSLTIAAPITHAYTVDEIIANGEWMTATYKYVNEKTNFYGILLSPYEDAGLHLEKVDNTHIKISGFGGSLSYNFTLGKATQISGVNYTAHSTVEAIDGDGDCLYLNSSAAPVDDTHAMGTYSWRIMSVAYNPQTRNYSNQQNGKYILMIKKATDGSLYLEEEEDFYGCILAENTATTAVSYNSIIESTVIRPFEYNAWCTDELHNWDAYFDYYSYEVWVCDRIPRQYPVYIEFDFEKNRFAIRNFSNHGMAYDDSTNNRNDLDKGHLGMPRDIQGTIIPSENKLQFDVAQPSRWALRKAGRGYDWYSFCPFYINEDNIEEIHEFLEGTYSFANDNKPIHNTNTVNHGWVTNHGKRRTYEDLAVEIEPYTYASNDRMFSYQINWDDSFTDTKIFSVDCTLDVSLNLSTVEWDTDAEQGRVKATIVTNKNDQYVDHYDIMVIGGHHDFIDASNFKNDDELGFENAKLLVDDENDNTYGTVTKPDTANAAVTGGEHDYTIDHWLKKDFLGDQYNSKGEYTFFIRANYKPDTGLSKTFHSLVHVTAPVITDIISINNDAGNDMPEYFNLNGVHVAIGDLRPGIYLCRHGNTVTKVVIR